MQPILWLDEIRPEHGHWVGRKALHLGLILQAGFPVPAGFCITTEAYGDFVAENELCPAVQDVLEASPQNLEPAAARLREAIRTGRPSQSLQQAIARAYHHLQAETRQPVRVAVRSSATAEDLSDASFAGQQATILGVVGEEDLLRAVQECWASLWSPMVVPYRARMHREHHLPSMALLVQSMVPAYSAGAGFSLDPVTGEDVLLIEAAYGLGETVVGGHADVDRYRVNRETLAEIGPPAIARKPRQRVMAPDGGVRSVPVPAEAQLRRCLRPEQVREVAEEVLALEGCLKCAVDVEWAYAEEQLFVLQARPITTDLRTYFTDVLPEDEAIWTSGFLNERFSRPVSPLGWSTIRELLEELAFRDPLRYLGCKGVNQLRITKLFRGHPYVNLFVFQTLYKVFPRSLLPEDAVRYFPQGKTELRQKVPYPRGLGDPRFLVSMLSHFLREPRVWSPWHNDRMWAEFVQRHQATMRTLHSEWQALDPEHLEVLATWELIERAQELNRQLLALHRWTLTHADLTYTLLRRLLRRWAGERAAPALFTGLIRGLPNKSLEANDALRRLAAIANSDAFTQALSAFLAEHGHRSFHLDIYYPTFSDDPQQVVSLVQRFREAERPGFGAHEEQQAQGKASGREQAVRLPWQQGAASDGAPAPEEALRSAREQCGPGPRGWMRRGILTAAARLARRYLPLREDQRYYWQQTLALMRRLFLGLGRALAQGGSLQHAEDVFFLTKTELKAAVLGQDGAVASAGLAASRRKQYARLCQEFDAAPEWAYPTFMRGNQPLEVEAADTQQRLQGRAVSAGLGRGRAIVLFEPSELSQVQAGDVLVARSVDPAWTAVFGLLAGLVTEHGGQLSHAAIVAREYGLPAVAGIAGATHLLRTGETVIVDGLSGVVIRVPGE